MGLHRKPGSDLISETHFLLLETYVLEKQHRTSRSKYKQICNVNGVIPVTLCSYVFAWAWLKNYASLTEPVTNSKPHMLIVT